MPQVICHSVFAPVDLPRKSGLFPCQNRIFLSESAGGGIGIFKQSFSIRCSGNSVQTKRTCKNCKGSFEPYLNHARACRFHTAHFGGETRRKFESVHSGGTMDTPDSGKVLLYWHCCGSEDPFDPGCTSGPHLTYDD